MLESLKEYFSSTVNTAAQRVSNPVFGAFAISWCAFNWKSILYLFLSDSGIIDKITYISDNSNWKTVALYPCISVAVLCGCLPWINNMISAWCYQRCKTDPPQRLKTDPGVNLLL